MSRVGWREYHMLQAEQASTRSTCSRLHVGCVIVSRNHVVSTGYNGAPRGIEHCRHTLDDTPCSISVHAEVNALLRCAHDGEVYDLEMYVTHAPCFECAKLIINKEISRVYYRETYRSTRGIELLETSDVLISRV